jgi:HSP20 family protein
MLLQKFTDRDLFGSLQDMQRLQRQLDRLMSLENASATQEFPPIAAWSSEHGAIVRAEIPGIDPNDVEITLVNDTLTIKGSRIPEVLKEGETCHRQERGSGQFTRSLQLPFGVEADEVKALFTNGILQITLPRAKAEKPKTIKVTCE